MSGGSYDYIFRDMEDFAAACLLNTPLRKAFAAHMLLVAKACHDIEWVDSGDMGDGDENAAILAVLGTDAPRAVMTELIKDGRKVLADLGAALSTIEGEVER